MNRLKTILFIPDQHWPFVDHRAYKVMLNVISQIKIDEVVWLGDHWDCYCVSDYGKDPIKNFKLLEEELIEGREALAQIEKITKAKSFVFLQGNHENRIDRYVAAYAGKLGNLVKTKDILQIPEHYRYIPYGQNGYYKCGKLIVTHGSLSNKHIAHAMLAKYGASVLFGHTHKVQEFQITNVFGEVLRGINIGWLGDAKKAAEYIKNVADWCHGFAIGYFKPNGDFFVQTIPIINYECVFNGELITNSNR